MRTHTTRTHSNTHGGVFSNPGTALLLRSCTLRFNQGPALVHTHPERGRPAPADCAEWAPAGGSRAEVVMRDCEVSDNEAGKRGEWLHAAHSVTSTPFRRLLASAVNGRGWNLDVRAMRD